MLLSGNKCVYKTFNIWIRRLIVQLNVAVFFLIWKIKICEWEWEWDNIVGWALLRISKKIWALSRFPWVMWWRSATNNFTHQNNDDIKRDILYTYFALQFAFKCAHRYYRNLYIKIIWPTCVCSVGRARVVDVVVDIATDVIVVFRLGKTQKRMERNSHPNISKAKAIYTHTRDAVVSLTILSSGTHSMRKSRLWSVHKTFAWNGTY